MAASTPRADESSETLSLPLTTPTRKNPRAWTTNRAAKSQAATSSDLTVVARSGPWIVYEVANSQLVEPLTVQPVVVNHRDGDQRERHLELGTSWFQNTEQWAALPADDGPDE